MATPNQMPRKPLPTAGWHRRNPLAPQILSALIETKPASWELKTLAKDGDGKEIVKTRKVTNNALRYALAQNVSEESVERLARRWL